MSSLQATAATPSGTLDTRSKLTLRAKGLLAIGALFGYLLVAALLVEVQRGTLADALGELERVHAEESRMERVNMSLARAIIATNERYERFSPEADLVGLVFAAEAVESGMDELAPRFPHLAGAAADIARRVRDLSAHERAALLELRNALHRAVEAMDRAAAEIRARKQELASHYRAAYDQVSMTWIGLGVVGMAVFGALLLLFLARLGWDLRRLEQRAVAVAKGYRGPALAVTRTDEIGALMGSVNRMQQELVAHEARIEMARRQEFHREKMAAVGALAAQVAHEINNPIAAIAGMAQELPEAAARRIGEQARRVAAITRQIAEFSSPQAAEAQLVDLNGLVESACAFARYDKRLGATALELELDRQVPAVHAVGDHVVQVLMNLLMNAADAIAEAGAAGRIRLTTEARDGAVVLGVADNGAGMSAAVQARAFEEFFTTKPKGKGCGIGLALSRRLLRENGADIDIASQPGSGTVVSVRLPTAP